MIYESEERAWSAARALNKRHGYGECRAVLTRYGWTVQLRMLWD